MRQTRTESQWHNAMIKRTHGGTQQDLRFSWTIFCYKSKTFRICWISKTSTFSDWCLIKWERSHSCWLSILAHILIQQNRKITAVESMFLFSCPEQLNRWPCHWVSEWPVIFEILWHFLRYVEILLSQAILRYYQIFWDVFIYFEIFYIRSWKPRRVYFRWLDIF